MIEFKYRDPASQPIWSVQVYPPRIVRCFLLLATTLGLPPPLIALVFAVSYPMIQYSHPLINASTDGALASLLILASIYMVVALVFMAIAAGMLPLRFKRLDAFPLEPMVPPFVLRCLWAVIILLFLALIPLNALFGLPPGVLPPHGIGDRVWAYSFWGFFYLNCCVAVPFMIASPLILWLGNQTDAEYFTPKMQIFISIVSVLAGLILAWMLIATAMAVRVM